jgi:hypothetical protein
LLTSGNVPGEKSRKLYLTKCCDEIKPNSGNSTDIASLCHIYDILASHHVSSTKSLKKELRSLVQPIIKLGLLSLQECQNNSINKAKLLNSKLDQTMLVDGIFTHEEVVSSILNLIRFILQEGGVYLSVMRVKEIWDTLIGN